MAVTPKRLVAGSLLTVSAATYYVSTGIRTRVDAMAITNTTGSAATATVHLIPSGGTADASNCILSAKSIAAGETYIVPGAIGQWLEVGGFIQALASAGTTLTLVASGVQFS